MIGAQGVLSRRALPGAGLRPHRPVPRRLLPRRRALRSPRAAGGARGFRRRGRRAVPALRHHRGRGLAAAAARADAPPRDRRQRRAHRGRAPHRGPRGPQPDGRQAPGQGRRAALGGHPAAVRRAGRGRSAPGLLGLHRRRGRGSGRRSARSGDGGVHAALHPGLAAGPGPVSRGAAGRKARRLRRRQRHRPVRAAAPARDGLRGGRERAPLRRAADHARVHPARPRRERASIAGSGADDERSRITAPTRPPGARGAATTPSSAR